MSNIIKNKDWLIVQNSFFNFETSTLLSPVETQNYQIIQVADSYYTSMCNIAKHDQVCDLEITYMIYNRLFCLTNGYSTRLQKNDVSISFKNETHSLMSPRICRFQTLAINFKLESPCFELFTKLTTLYASHEKRKIYLPEIETLFSTLLFELSNKDQTFNTLMIDAIITNMLVRISRYNTKTKAPAPIQPNELPSKITEYIDNNFLSILSLNELSNIFGYSYNYLCKVYMDQYNTTIHHYLLDKKMTYAQLLLSENKSVQEVAKILGYSNPYNFSRAFKNHFKSPPRTFFK